MNKDKIEHIKDAVSVASRYCDIVAVRASDLVTTSQKSVNVTSWEKTKKDTVINSFEKYATVPVINMESNLYHPCQGLADAMTISEKLKNYKNKKYVLTWTYHPKSLPMATPNSQFLAACDLGMDVTIVHPEGWELDEDIISLGRERAKGASGSLSISHNQKEAFKGANVICAKSWGALKYYGNLKLELGIKSKLTSWIVTKKLMQLTNNAYFMHCLPVRRNVEVSDEVLDSTNSLIIDEAENRMWSQMSLLSELT